MLRKQEGIRFHSSSTESHLGFPGLLKLEELRKQSLNQVKLDNIYDLMLDYDLHVAAYEKVRKNKGSNTPGVDGITLDGISISSIRETIKRLKDHTFKFKPSRREYIPKANGKLRPLGISSPIDKVVQQVMVFILEVIWDNPDNPIFINSSHGFRRNKGTHTALKEISYWSGIEWFIEGDIKSYFDTIDHHIIENILMTRISDRQFLDLYWKSVKAGYVEVKKNNLVDNIIGTPQGSVLSPFLSNLYLHEFDKWMQDKRNEGNISSGPTSVPLPKEVQEYLKLHSKIHNLKLNKGQTLIEKQNNNLKSWIVERGKLPSKLKSSGFRISYVRYADDFLIGINGPESLAISIKGEIDAFLKDKLKLTLSWEKTKITSAKKGKALFLGAEIYRPVSRTGIRIFSSRIPTTRLALFIPVKNIILKLQNQGFCVIKDYDQGNIIPKGKTSWINLTLYDIIQKYNSVLTGIRNYYSFAHNRSRLQFIQYILLHSCAKLIANKLKLNTRAQVFKKFGSNIKVKSENEGKTRTISFKILKSHKMIKRFMINPNDPFATIYNLRSRSNLEKERWICSSNDQVEIHHIKALKGQSKGFIGIMKAINIKQIPVCRPCHMNIHT
jgi:group II intron reverse transcriptase/maturase